MKIENDIQLREIYGFPGERAKNKVLSALDKHAINYITKSPFIALSSISKNGKMDTSPRGGANGFVKIVNSKEIVIPDFKGNNRLDSLTNIIETGTIALLFIIPGIDETLRVNGNAYITTSKTFLDLFETESKLPISCIVVSIDEVFLHCAKAFMRSKLWKRETQINPLSFPTMGEMLKDQMGLEGESESRDDMIKRYMNDL